MTYLMRALYVHHYFLFVFVIYYLYLPIKKKRAIQFSPFLYFFFHIMITINVFFNKIMSKISHFFVMNTTSFQLLCIYNINIVPVV